MHNYLSMTPSPTSTHWTSNCASQSHLEIPKGGGLQSMNNRKVNKRKKKKEQVAYVMQYPLIELSNFIHHTFEPIK